MSNYKDCQIIQLENDELRIRIKELTAQLESAKTNLQQLAFPKLPSKVYHLEKGKVGGKTQYTIVDEKGYFEDSFFCEDNKKAILFFDTYIKEKKPTKTSVVASGIRGGEYVSLIYLECQFISAFEDLKLIPSAAYMVYVGKDCIKQLPTETTEQEALALYNQELERYFAEREITASPKQIII